MSGTVKRTCVVLAVLALCAPTVVPVLLALVGGDRLLEALGSAAFVVMVLATLGITVAAWLSSRRDALLRRGATASTVCSALVAVSIAWLYALSGPEAVPAAPLGLLLLGLVAHVVVTVLLPVTAAGRAVPSPSRRPS